MGKYFVAMASKNSKKVNDKQKKIKDNKEELTKNKIWKAVGAFVKVCLNCLETKSKSRRRRCKAKPNVLNLKKNERN